MFEEGEDVEPSEPSFFLSDQPSSAAHVLPSSLPSSGFQAPVPALPIVDSTPTPAVPLPSGNPEAVAPVLAIKVEKVDESMIPQATQAKAGWMEFDMGPAPLKIEADLNRGFSRLDSGDHITSIPSVGLDPESILLDNELIDKELDHSQKLEDLHLNWAPTPKAQAAHHAQQRRSFPFKQENRYHREASPSQEIDYYDAMEVSRPQTLSVPNWDEPSRTPTLLSPGAPNLLLSPHPNIGITSAESVFDPFLISPRGFSQQQQLLAQQQQLMGHQQQQILEGGVRHAARV